MMARLGGEGLRYREYIIRPFEAHNTESKSKLAESGRTVGGVEPYPLCTQAIRDVYLTT